FAYFIVAQIVNMGLPRIQTRNYTFRKVKTGNFPTSMYRSLREGKSNVPLPNNGQCLRHKSSYQIFHQVDTHASLSKRIFRQSYPDDPSHHTLHRTKVTGSVCSSS